MAVSDKLDTIAGMFAIGEPPTGSKDPFALRRSAIGLLNILRSRLGCGYEELVAHALASYASRASVRCRWGSSCRLRLHQGPHGADDARRGGVSVDVVAAVSAGSVRVPASYLALSHALEDARANDAATFENLATAYARASHLADASLGVEVDSALLAEAEANLLTSTDQAQQRVSDALAAGDFTR